LMPNTPILFALLLVSALMAFAASPPAAVAQVDVFEFETAEQERRFRQLSQEFRCPMCQNANLADSPGGVAEDLRREIYNLIMEGSTDQEIEQFMHQRYGDFIFYRPRLTSRTVLLWFGPLLFFAIGGFVIFGIIRRGRAQTSKTGATLSQEEQQRLKKLMGRKTSADNGSITDR
jgi:cytochrome c-type biogenesis protein CcmH